MWCFGISFPNTPTLTTGLLLSRQARPLGRTGTDGTSQSTFVGGLGSMRVRRELSLCVGEIGFAMPDAASSLVRKSSRRTGDEKAVCFAGLGGVAVRPFGK